MVEKSGKTVAQYIERRGPCRVSPTFPYVSRYISGRTLDIGCGTGEYLEKFSAGSIGVDASLVNVRECRQKGLQVIQADINSGLAFEDQSFQTVFCSHVIEHVDSPVLLLRETNRVLRCGGGAIFAVPAEKTGVRLFSEDYFDDHETHLYGFSVECLERLFRQAGLTEVKVFYQFPRISRVSPFQSMLKRLGSSCWQYMSTMFWIIAFKPGVE